MSKSVAIFGGGVAGLSAAHELIDRGFIVTIYEAGDTCGGKARSFGKPGSATGGRKLLPGEHGFRFFPGFYRHITDSMMGIPCGSGSAFDKLVPTAAVGIARDGKPVFQLPVHVPLSISGWLSALQQWFGHADLGVPVDEVLFFNEKLFEFITSCDDRRMDEHESTSWWTFVDADHKSQAYQNLLARGLTRSLVAMRAEVASTRTIATILWHMLFCMANPLGPAADRVLSAPTSDVWLDPWVAYLQGRGVTIQLKSRAQAIVLGANGVAAVQVSVNGGAAVPVQADYHLFAVPQEVMAALATPAVVAAAPSLAGVAALHVDWMNGIQYFLKRDVAGPGLPMGHMILSEAPWALTVLSQRPFWPDVDFANLGNGDCLGILSVDISDWEAPGTYVNKPARQCTDAEISEEVWKQLKAHLQPAALQDTDLITHFLDPAIKIGPPNQNDSPLLINTVDSWRLRPQAATKIANLFLASDYVQTTSDLACMEGANEAARLAVNAILLAAGAQSTPQCATWPLGDREPAIFKPAKIVDQVFYDLGLPHPGAATMRNLLKV